VAASLEVARLLKGHTLRRTLRVCSFGAEEMLSEGSRWYVMVAGGAKDVSFVVNNDGSSARIGVTGLHLTGTASMTRWFKRAAARAKMPLEVIEDVCPFSDQFPFNAQGIPSAWFYRQTTTAGRHYHHTVQDTLGVVSFEQIARLAAFEADFILRLANASRLPFPTVFDEKVRREVRKARKAWMTI
jgi:Zn-dependent M28 family amino/carboxypeptidase